MVTLRKAIIKFMEDLQESVRKVGDKIRGYLETAELAAEAAKATVADWETEINLWKKQLTDEATKLEEDYNKDANSCDVNDCPKGILL